MRLLYITPSYYPALKYGGPILSTHLLNKTLVQRGIEVDVITSNAGIEDRKDIPLGKWVELNGVKVQYLPYYGYEHYTFSPQILWTTIQIASRYELIHINVVWNFPVLAGSLASIIRRKPYIISPRGTLYKEAMGIKSEKKKKLYYYLMARHYLKRAMSIHFTTENEKRETLEHMGLQIPSFVVPNGIDLTEFNNLPTPGAFKNNHAILQGKRYLLFLGRIHIIKGLDILVDSFKKMALEYPDLHLVVVGPDSEGYEKKIKSLLGEAGILSRTLFTGMLTGSDKLSALVDAECFVLPSYSENFGMAVAEAMACGIPVIISNKVGIYEEVERERAGIIVDTKVDSLYNGIKALLDDESLRKKIADNGKRFVHARYDVQKVADQMIEVYERLVHARR